MEPLVVLLGREVGVGELVWSSGGMLLSLDSSGRLCCWDPSGTKRWQRHFPTKAMREELARLARGNVT